MPIENLQAANLHKLVVDMESEAESENLSASVCICWMEIFAQNATLCFYDIRATSIL